MSLAEPPVSYVEPTAEGSWRVAGSRVSLDSVVYAYREGRSPEQIRADFPTLSLEQVHGALAYYLRHQGEVDHYLEEQSALHERLRAENELKNPDLVQGLRAVRER